MEKLVHFSLNFLQCFRDSLVIKLTLMVYRSPVPPSLCTAAAASSPTTDEPRDVQMLPGTRVLPPTPCHVPVFMYGYFCLLYHCIFSCDEIN